MNDEAVQEQDNTKSEHDIQFTLRRLLHYYDGRAKVAARMMRETVDYPTICGYALSAATWEAKRDAVLKVAENLEIALELEAKR